MMGREGTPIASSPHFKVTPHRPLRRVAIIFASGLAMVAGAYGLYELGRHMGGYDSRRAGRQIALLEEQIDQLQNRNSVLLDQNAVLDRASRIDRKANDDVRLALNSAQQQSLKLREELAFYKSLVLPSEMEPGLHLQKFAVVASDNQQSFDYKLVLTQVRQNNREAVGSVRLLFSGRKDGKNITYALSDVSRAGAVNLTFRFKYFQSFAGSVQFPPGFEPQSVSLSVRPQGRRLKSVKHTLEWRAVLARSE